MNCGRCSRPLAPGAAHMNAESCLEAALHEIVSLSTCRECGEAIETPIHPLCAPAVAAKRITHVGVKAVEKRVSDAINDGIANLLNPEKKKGGKRFDP